MRTFVLVLGLLAACKSSPDYAEVTGPETLVEGAIEAVGGSAALAEINSYHHETEGTWMGMPYTAVAHYRAPYDWRWEMKSDMANMTAWVLGPDHAAYHAMGGKAMALEGAMREQMLGHMRVSNGALLPDRLLDEDVVLEEVAPVMVGETSCPSVRATFGGLDPATYSFDPESKLLKRVEFLMWDEQTGEKSPASFVVEDWRDVGGVLVAHKTTMTWTTAGQPAQMVESLVDLRWNDDIPDEVLTAPEVAPTPDLTVEDQPETDIAYHLFVGPYQDVGNGITAVHEWIAAHGGTLTGGPALIYKDPPPADLSQAKTVIHWPVAGIEATNDTVNGEVRLMRQPAFTFAYMLYEGPVNGCYMLIPSVEMKCTEMGYRRSGPPRVVYLGEPDEQGNCQAHVGMPVKRMEPE